VAGTSTFRIDRTRTGARETLAPAGELDSGSCPALIEAFERVATEFDGRELHLDLSRLSFIDSAGLRAIIRVERAARERALALVVTPPPAPLTELLQLTGLAERLTLAAHSATAPPFRSFLERVEIDMPPEQTAPRRARDEVRQLADGLLDGMALEAATLLTSELVTNAIVHPPATNGDTVRLRITSYGDGLRCEISDRGPGFDPASLRPRTPDAGGRGLMLVDALASRWGTDRVNSGGEERFCVWFEVDAGAVVT
jgi:anti-anti-sigma factor